MFIDICLIWIGMQLNAPAWYYCLVGFAFIVNVISFGRNMFNKGKASANKEIQGTR